MESMLIWTLTNLIVVIKILYFKLQTFVILGEGKLGSVETGTFYFATWSFGDECK